ncbi:endogenous retrovirus group 3 member 1 Env polyprotein [Melanerpes formicivorus]|uniref:endogenous retrovirus group 3 member 1 Env polyprotein n=1 Tax=Melanerpes formicivorus TaxID=211600 RepID=UPI00358F140F
MNKMFVFLFWCTLGALTLDISASAPSDPNEGFLVTNLFMQLAEEVSSVYNLMNCWVCGGPQGFEAWPWVSTPVAPKWLVSSLSEVDKNTFWTEEDTAPWPVQYPGQGIYCLNRTQPGGVFVGRSTCQWTFTYRNLRLQNQKKRPSFRHTSGWMWVNKTGGVKDFEGFWSRENVSRIYDFRERFGPLLYQSCEWKNDSGAWYCTMVGHAHPEGRWNHVLFPNPLGMTNSTYFQMPTTPTGLFENGTTALKGHYWICGHRAYKKLPRNWTGICYVGLIHPLFFLLPGGEGNALGIKVYDNLGKRKRSISTHLTRGSGQQWGKGEWTPQRIIEYYGPATWNPYERISGA